MQASSFQIDFNRYANASELGDEDQKLIEIARKLAQEAYAPYSGFQVASVALMKNGNFIHGTNQENASYPIGLCAERVMLAAISSLASDSLEIKSICISYTSSQVPTDKPIAPCGICRQSLTEFESRMKSSLRLLLTGQTGEVYEFASASSLLPMAFKKGNLNK